MKNSPQAKDNNNQKVIVRQTQMFSGPLPHPDVLERYNAVVPGAAERIIAMAENQSAHRIEIEKKVINSDIKNSRRGQLFGFIIAVIGLLSSVILIIYGFGTSGTILGGATLLALVGVFVQGSITRSNERIEKDASIKGVVHEVDSQ